MVPTTRVPEGWRLMMVPARVIAAPPAEMVVPSMEKAEGLGVKVWPATVNGGMGNGVRSETVELPMISAPN